MYITPPVSKLPGTGPQIVWVLGSPNGGGDEDHLGAAQAVNHRADALGVLDHQVLLCPQAQQAVQEANSPHFLLRNLLDWKKTSNPPRGIPLDVLLPSDLSQVPQVPAC